MVLVGTGRLIAQKNTPVPTGTNQYHTLHSSGGVEVGGFRGRCSTVAQGDSNPLAPTIIILAKNYFASTEGFAVREVPVPGPEPAISRAASDTAPLAQLRLP